MGFALVFTTLMAAVYWITKAPIEKSVAEARLSLFRQLITAEMFDNDVLNDIVTIGPEPLLGNMQPVNVHIAKKNGVASAVILEATAHDGYSGDIQLLIAIHANGTLAGVRVIAHKETPGLGDYIDIAKDTWIKLFDQKSLSNPSEDGWKVKKDGGQFDYIAGATITPRAVVKAVHQALVYFQQHQTTLLNTPSTSEITS